MKRARGGEAGKHNKYEALGKSHTGSTPPKRKKKRRLRSGKGTRMYIIRATINLLDRQQRTGQREPVYVWYVHQKPPNCQQWTGQMVDLSTDSSIQQWFSCWLVGWLVEGGDILERGLVEPVLVVLNENRVQIKKQNGVFSFYVHQTIGNIRHARRTNETTPHSPTHSLTVFHRPTYADACYGIPGRCTLFFSWGVGGHIKFYNLTQKNDFGGKQKKCYVRTR